MEDRPSPRRQPQALAGAPATWPARCPPPRRWRRSGNRDARPRSAQSECANDAPPLPAPAHRFIDYEAGPDCASTQMRLPQVRSRAEVAPKVSLASGKGPTALQKTCPAGPITMAGDRRCVALGTRLPQHVQTNWAPRDKAAQQPFSRTTKPRWYRCIVDHLGEGRWPLCRSGLEHLGICTVRLLPHHPAQRASRPAVNRTHSQHPARSPGSSPRPR